MATLVFKPERDSLGEPVRHMALYGIPARDVEEEELTTEQVALALDSGLYERKGKTTNDLPVWYRALAVEAAKAGTMIADLQPGETQKQFRERTGAAGSVDDSSDDETG